MVETWPEPTVDRPRQPSVDQDVEFDVPDVDTGGPGGGSSVRGQASWYCSSSSACTHGYPGGLYAAAGPALRIGDWRGRHVTISTGGKSVQVTLIDWCGCPSGRVIDLYSDAFSRLAPTSQGTLRVTVSW